MFPSTNDCDNPFESLLKRSSSFPSDHQNPSSKQDDPPFLFNFPSPFFDEHELPLNQIFFQNQLMAGNTYVADTDPTKKDETKRDIGASNLIEKEADRQIPSGIVAPMRRRNLGVIPRRRTGKKDRHSKICTAQGIRDRRMRLSLQVARKFFDLQDMLGYDKASKTIEWLFTKSKKAIKELINDHPQANNISTSDAKSESFVSECDEVVSGILHEENSNKDVKESIVPAATVMPLCINPCEKDQRKTRKPACKPNKRESREKARARARCRTREKMMVKRLEFSGQWYKANPSEKLGSSNTPFEGVDQESNSNNQERVSPYEAAYNSLEQQLADVGTIEKFLGTSSSSTSCPISDYHCSAAAVSGFTDPNSNFMGFLGNWDLLHNDRTNSFHYSVTNQVSLAGNPNSVYSAITEFP